MCKDRTNLPVSSAKSVAGHGDAVGAFVSIIHAIAAMEIGMIPPVKNFVAPRPDARALIDGRLRVSAFSLSFGTVYSLKHLRN